MPKSLVLRLRTVWRTVHLWLGLALALASVPLGLSGSALVWRDSLQQMQSPQRYAAADRPAALAPSVYLAAASRAFAGRATPTQLRLPGPDGGPVVVTGRIGEAPASGPPRQLAVWLDPANAHVREVGDPQAGPMGVIHRLHGNFMLAANGRLLVGWVGVGLLLSALTGLWLWWPLQGSVLRGLRWRRGGSALFNLHHRVGVWVCVPLAILSLTGAYIAFPLIRAAVTGIPAAGPDAGRPAGRRGEHRAGHHGAPHLRLTVDQAADAARAAAGPGAALASINLPGGGREASWRVQVRPAGSQDAAAYTVRDADSSVTQARSGPGVQDPFSRAVRRLHDGGGMPVIWQVIITLAGLAPTVFAVSGLVMWRRRVRRAPARPAEAALAAE